MTLGDQRVVVTGAASGLGQGIAQMFCAEGAAVAGIDIQDAGETARLCGSRFRAFTADVADEDEVAGVFGEVDEHFGGGLTVLCNVAGIAPEIAFLDTPASVFDRVMAVNVRGPFLCAQQAARRMKAAGGGRIVNITSTEAELAWALQSVYGASKAALRHLTMGMAVELAADGITVNAVGPGACETPALAVQMQSGRIAQHDLERTPLGRHGRPADIAAAVRFLAVDATWLTGQTIYVDGGYLAAGLPMFPEIAAIRRGLPEDV
jgi:NAD(P)-dependent dehydrogenase (short-subunit alcohol dehydrogenase family)